MDLFSLCKSLLHTNNAETFMVLKRKESRTKTFSVGVDQLLGVNQRLGVTPKRTSPFHNMFFCYFLRF